MFDVKPIIETAQQAVAPQFITIDGRQYGRSDLKLIAPPTIETLQAETLQSVVDYVQRQPDGQRQSFIHLEDYNTVSVKGTPDAVTNQRPCYLRAHAKERWTANRPGLYVPQQEFIIWLLQGFAPSSDLLALLQMAGSLKAEKIVEAGDNGIAQAVAVKQGIQSTYTEVKNPVQLRPYRTFAEIEPPDMTFVVRLQNGKENEPPKLGLFIADSGQWELEALARIRHWLRTQLPDHSIIG
jgi:hypothetical protein